MAIVANTQKNPFRKNLLKNPKALEDLQHWTLTGDEYPNPEVESEPYGADPITDYIPAFIVNGPIKNWVTSYRYTSITQHVEFIEDSPKLAATVMDQLRPPIYASVWFAARSDCGVKFKLQVELKDAQNKTVQTFESERVITEAADLRKWHKMEYTFKDYSAGVRSAKFTMGGMDTKYWKGNYGAKFTLPCLQME